MHTRICICLEILCWYLWYLVTRGSVLHQSCYYRETLQTYSLQIHSPLALVIFLRFISNILAIFVQWKGVTIRLNHDYISSPHDVTAGNHYFFLATSLSKWVLSKEGLFYKKSREIYHSWSLLILVFASWFLLQTDFICVVISEVFFAQN